MSLNVRAEKYKTYLYHLGWVLGHKNYCLLFACVILVIWEWYNWEICSWELIVFMSLGKNEMGFFIVIDWIWLSVYSCYYFFWFHIIYLVVTIYSNNLRYGMYSLHKRLTRADHWPSLGSGYAWPSIDLLMFGVSSGNIQGISQYNSVSWLMLMHGATTFH